MSDSSTASLFLPRERRVLLWLCVGAVCWRWLLAIRAPLPGVDAALDLWVAQGVAKGHLAVLGDVWWRPWWAMCVAPAVACGAAPFAAAQVLGCLCGGLVIWPVAAAAERLRQGAGIPSAVLALAAAMPAQGAAMATALPLATFASAMAVLCWVRGRWVACLLLTTAVAVMGHEHLLPAAKGESAGGFLPIWNGVRAAWSLAGAFAVLSVLPPRPRRIVGVWVATGTVLVVAVVLGVPRQVLPLWSPLVAVLAGVGLARWPRRLAEVAIAAVVVVDFLAAWQATEARDAIVERLLGAHLAAHAGPAQVLVSDLPRLTFFAGAHPRTFGSRDALLHAASQPETAFVALSPAAADATTTSALSGRFMRYQVPVPLRDLVVDRRIAIFARRE
jgi:hypothetical protein